MVGQEPNVSPRDVLLRWAKRSTSKYSGVRITDFTSSWRDGLAFNAIIHRNRPDLIDWRSIRQRQIRERLENAFHVAEREYGVTRLLDVEGNCHSFYSLVLEAAERNGRPISRIARGRSFKMSNQICWQLSLKTVRSFPVFETITISVSLFPDVDTNEPDEKSLITYISSLYDVFPDPPVNHPLLDSVSI